MSMDFRNITVCENMLLHSCSRLLYKHGHHCNDIIGMHSLACCFLAVLRKVVFAVAKQSTDLQELSASCYRPDHCVGQCVCLQDCV